MAAGGSSNPSDEKFNVFLNPIQDAETNFGVDITKLLEDFNNSLANGVDFNLSGLYIQGATGIYGRKVDHLRDLCSNLSETMCKTSHNTQDDSKEAENREERIRRRRIIDPFCDTEIEVGKNISDLEDNEEEKRKILEQRIQKRANTFGIHTPISLLPVEEEEKGLPFYDVHGKHIGSRSDFLINRCRITEDGWLMFPGMSLSKIKRPTDVVDTDRYLDVDMSDQEDEDTEVPCTPGDEGYPTSECPSSANTSQVISTQGTDEGLGSIQSTPCMGLSEATIIKTEPESPIDTPLPSPGPSRPEQGAIPKLRRSTRQALKQVQEKELERPEKPSEKEDIFGFRSEIEHKNTVHMPLKLKVKREDENNPPPLPAADYCAKAFFGVEESFQKSELFSLQSTAFANNTKFAKLIEEMQEELKTKGRVERGIEFSDDEEEDDEDDVVEQPLDYIPDDGPPPNPDLTYDNFSIVHAPRNSFRIENPPATENPLEDNVASGDVPYEDVIPDDILTGEAEYFQIVGEEMAVFRDELRNFVPFAGKTEQVNDWWQSLEPFLEDINSREPFDINQYGYRIINAFPDGNGRHTIRFRDFCQGMEKWQIHRYFMALLPLANKGNVEIKKECNKDGPEDDILITILSRKMHHLELENFGHSTGEHK